MPGSLEILQKLQSIDLEVGALEEESRGYRERIERLSAEIEKIEAEAEAAKAALAETEAAMKEVGETARESSERVKKDEGKMLSVTSDKALRALEKEMASARKNMKLAGERLDGLTAEAGDRKAKADGKLAEVDSKRNEVQGVAAEMEAKTPEWDKALSEKAAERERLAESLEPSLLKRYEAIRARRRGLGLVEVRAETCQGCFMRIPPQFYIRLVKGDDEMMTCPNCHRLLYYQRGEQTA